MTGNGYFARHNPDGHGSELLGGERSFTSSSGSPSSNRLRGMMAKHISRIRIRCRPNPSLHLYQ